MGILGLRDEISRFRLDFFPKYSPVPTGGPVSTRDYHRMKCECWHNCVVHEGSHSDTCSPMPACLDLIDRIISNVLGMDLEASERILLRGPKWGAADIC